MSRTFELALDGLSMAIPQGRITSYDRTPVKSTAVGHTITGTATIRGTQQRKLIWTMSLLLTELEYERLQGFEARSDLRRVQLATAVSVTVVDKLRRVVEDGARTRAIAPQTLETVENGQTRYFGVFKGYITNLKAPASPGDGKFLRVSFDIVETDFVAA